MSSQTFPARVHILLARDVPYAVALRRGPSKEVAAIGWDRSRDTFELGQWLRGRIYERRSDLSPDGRHLIYFALDGNWQGEAKGSWTALSRAPYLTALTIYPKGDGWHGGGLFTGPTRYWLNDGYGHQAPLRESPELRRDRQARWSESYGGECLGVYFHRLQRDGWRLERETLSRSPAEFTKPLPSGWTLRKLAHAGIDQPEGKGCYWDSHRLESPDGRVSLDQPDWEWADLDGERLVWVERGRLETGRPVGAGIEERRVLFDFNPMEFEERVAPE